MTDLSRRALLGLAAALPLAACTSDDGPPPAPDPDDLLRDAAVARERALLAMYDGQTALSPALAGVRAEHAEHLAALLGAATTAEPSAAPSAPVAVAALVAAEREAAAAHGSAALEASRELAGVLASLAASEASHAVVLA